MDEKIRSLLNNHLVFICAEETDFWQLYDTSAGSDWKITSTQFTVKDHNGVSLTYGDFEERLGVCDHEIIQIMQFAKTTV